MTRTYKEEDKTSVITILIAQIERRKYNIKKKREKERIAKFHKQKTKNEPIFCKILFT